MHFLLGFNIQIENLMLRLSRALVFRGKDHRQRNCRDLTVFKVHHLSLKALNAALRVMLVPASKHTHAWVCDLSVLHARACACLCDACVCTSVLELRNFGFSRLCRGVVRRVFERFRERSFFALDFGCGCFQAISDVCRHDSIHFRPSKLCPAGLLGNI